MKRWLKRVLIALCVMTLGITAAAFVGCSSCDDGDDSSSTVESSVNDGSSSTGTGGSSNSGETGEHVWVETVVEATCYAGGYTINECSICGEVVTSNQTPKAACSYEKVTVAATCTEDGYDQFTCKWCADTYKNVTVRATGHDTEGAVWTAGEDMQIEGSCTYLHVETAKCNDCQETVTFEEEVEKHTYVVSSIAYATCAEAGEKTYTCTNCYEDYTEEIAIDANAHAWDGGVTEGSITTYTCANENAHTKKVVSAKQEVAATVPATALKEAGAVELMNAEMKLDADALASIGTGDVNLSADTADKATVMEKMSAADQEKLGDNEIFDFTMTDGDGAAIAFNGKITVTVPYELPYGEDPENIAIWYINDEGKPEAIEASYSCVNGQGYATFETSHFSYYTVVRLSVAERCEMYGHKFETRVVPAVCGEQGYTVTECKRCHMYERSAFTPALVHAYDTAVTAPTCSEMGYTTYTCSLCGDKYVSDRTAKLAHTYADTVVAPTCTADGYTLHKCSLCGESYTDTVVKATGHSYANGSCSVCGRQDPNASTNFYFNLIDSLANADTFYFEVKDLKMSAEMKYNNGDTEIMVYEMNLARAQIGFDETGIVGKGEGTLIGSMKETGSVNYEENYFATVEFLFANGNIYAYVDGTGLTGEGAGRSQMVMCAPQNTATAEMEDEMGMSMEMIMQMVEAYGSGAMDIVAGMANVNDSPLNSAIKAVVEYIYTKTETANGYSFELNENRLKDMYNILMTKSVSEIFNLVFGADAYQNVQAWLVASVDKTIPAFEAEVKTELVNWGIDLEEVYDYIDSIMFAGVEMPEGTPAPSVRDYIFAEELKEVTLLDIINMAMGEMLEAPLTADAVKEMINAYGEMIGAIKMEDIMDMMGGMNGSVSSKDSAMGREVVGGDLEQMPEIDVEAILDGIVAFLNKIPVTFTTDKVGTLIDFTVSMNNLDPKEIVELFGEDMDGAIVPVMSATMKFVLNGTYAGEYDHIVKEAEKLAGANDIKEDIFTEDFIVVVEEDATYVWTGSYYYQAESFGKETYNGVECTKVEVYTEYIYVLDEDAKDVITAMSDCHGWWEISIQAHEIYGAYAYAWVNAEGDIIGVELNLDKLGKQYDWSTSIELFYNPATGEYATTTQHNYKLVKTVKGVGCAETYDLYVCSVCGMEERDYYGNGHDWERRYVLAEGSVTCEDGAICEEYCTKCGRIDYTYETTSHQYNYEDKLVYTSPVCGAVYVRVGACPCGEKTYVYDRYSWTMDCQIDHVRGEWIQTEGTKYTYHYIDTYACSIEGCGFTYTREELEWYEYDATATDNDKTCKFFDVYTYDFGDGVTLTQTNWSYSHRTTSSSIGNSYGGTTYTYTCTLCNEITEISTYNELGRIVRMEYPINGPDSGWRREWNGCNYQDYSLNNEPQGSGTSHNWVWSAHDNACTQYVPNGEWCNFCGETRAFYEAPDYWWYEDHEYDWDNYYETYICRRCGTKNATGADGWIVLEDMVEGNELKVGYFNKYDGWWNQHRYAFDTLEITIVANYDPNNADGDYGVELGGEELFTKEVTSPVGYREAGILTLDYDALYNAVHNPDLGISVETVSVVFWIELTSETTGEAYVVGYGLTFTLGELGL